MFGLEEVRDELPHVRPVHEWIKTPFGIIAVDVAEDECYNTLAELFADTFDEFGVSGTRGQWPVRRSVVRDRRILRRCQDELGEEHPGIHGDKAGHLDHV